MANIINRIYQIANYENISISEFSKEVGVSNGYFAKQKASSASIGSHILEKIVSRYKHINPTWLITGEGKMTRDNKENKDMREIAQALSWLACSSYAKENNISFDHNAFVDLSDEFRQLSMLVGELQNLFDGEIGTAIVSNMSKSTEEDNTFIVPNTDQVFDKYIPIYIKLSKSLKDGLAVFEDMTKNQISEK